MASMAEIRRWEELKRGREEHDANIRAKNIQDARGLGLGYDVRNLQRTRTPGPITEVHESARPEGPVGLMRVEELSPPPERPARTLPTPQEMERAEEESLAAKERAAMLGPDVEGQEEMALREQEEARRREPGLMNISKEGQEQEQPQSEPKETDPPETKELKELQKKAVKDKGAQKIRKDMFAGLSPEEKAFVKEEMGNYYIDPGSGLAINLTALEKSNKRAANMALLKHFPDHQKASMLMSWGYIDKEDYEALPDSPEYRKQELITAQALAEGKQRIEGDLSSIGAKIKGEISILAMKNATAEKLATQEKVRQTTVLNLQNKHARLMAGDKFKHIKIESERERAVVKQLHKDTGINKEKIQRIISSSDIVKANINRQANNYAATMSGYTATKVASITGKYNEIIKKYLADKSLTAEEARSKALVDVADIERTKAENVQTIMGFWGDSVSRREQTVAEKKIASDERISKANIDLRQLLGKKHFDFEEIKLEGTMIMATERSELEQYIFDQTQIENKEKLAAVTNQFEQTIKLDRDRLNAKTDYEKKLLKQSGKQWKEDFKLKSETQRAATVMAQYNSDVALMKTFFLDGQIESAYMVADRLGIEGVPDIHAYWKAQSESSGTDTSFIDAARGAGLTAYNFKDPKSMQQLGRNFYAAKSALMDDLRDTRTDSVTGLTTLESHMQDAGIQVWEDMSQKAQETVGGNKFRYYNNSRREIFKKLMAADQTFGKLYTILENNILRTSMNRTRNSLGTTKDKAGTVSSGDTAINLDKPGMVTEGTLPEPDPSKEFDSDFSVNQLAKSITTPHGVKGKPLSNIQKDKNQKKLRDAFNKGEQELIALVEKEKKVPKMHGKVKTRRIPRFTTVDEALDYFLEEGGPGLLTSPDLRYYLAKSLNTRKSRKGQG